MSSINIRSDAVVAIAAAAAAIAGATFGASQLTSMHSKVIKLKVIKF